jgi:hypothetical protein
MEIGGFGSLADKISGFPKDPRDARDLALTQPATLTSKQKSNRAGSQQAFFKPP